MKFFEKQKIDEIGIASVKLQKFLIALMVIAVVSAFIGMDFLVSGFTLILYSLCFFGAYKRRINYLRFYYWFHIVVGIIFIGAIIIGFISFSSQANDNQDLNTTQTPSSGNSTQPDTYYNSRSESGTGGSDDTASQDLQAPNNTSIDIQSSQSTSSAPFVAVLFVVIVGIIIMTLKIATVVMAFRLAKMLRAQTMVNLEHPVRPRVAPINAPSPNVMYTPVPAQAQQNVYMYPYNPYLAQQQQQQYLQQQYFMNPYINPVAPPQHQLEPKL